VFNRVRIAHDVFDVGAVAEALVYYGHVDVILTDGTLPKLIEAFGFENAQRAVELGLLSFAYQRQTLGVRTTDKAIKTHSFLTLQMSGTVDKRQINSHEDQIAEFLQRNLNRSQKTRDMAKWVASNAELLSPSPQLLKQARQLLGDEQQRNASFTAYLKEVAPEFQMPEVINFTPTDFGNDEFMIATNLDFTEINKSYHRRTPPSHSTITPAFLISTLLDAKWDAYLAAKNESDIWIPSKRASVLQAQINVLAARTQKSQITLDLFRQVAFEGLSIREAVNEGRLKPSDLIDLLDTPDAKKFKEWVKAQPIDANLVKEYHKAVFSSPSWQNTLKFKAGRIATMAGLGALADAVSGMPGIATTIGAAAGVIADVVTGVGDEFVVGKLLKGWRPNQFIDQAKAKL
jgi:hypothetical protein